MAEINGIQVPFKPIVTREQFPSRGIEKASRTFDSIFKEELEKLKFSNHARKRLESRNIEFSNEEMSRLNTAYETAKQKGAKDSLIVLDETALIINIPNKTVVTALPMDKGSENIFTNIDSVVFAK